MCNKFIRICSNFANVMSSTIAFSFEITHVFSYCMHVYVLSVYFVEWPPEERVCVFHLN